METYQYTLGHEWYEKAIERGATDQSVNADLKSIISKMDKTKRNEMIEHLLKLDHLTYSWLKSLKVAVVNNPKIKQNKVEQTVKAQKKASPPQSKKTVQNKQPKNSEKSLQSLLEQGAKAHNLENPASLSKPSCMKPKKK